MIYNTPKELLSEIKHIMDLRDIPMKDLASRLNVSQQTVSKIFGKSNPQLSTVLQICEALNIAMDIKFVDNE
ncbi:helix-turn-helix transcriptional regulator [Enterocloster sp. OA13]|uniref:Helix-turn-helix transcriptional regulator n=1 Tax=Enterocloster hominis (ex Hitch et al. 2024) TaxID=1917870 RepID=A0ABV1D8P9_9FIRM|nr:helix-turn-helix transcriptional regulator [Lachnoclostridium pacaense]MCC2879473.1 helix-turn-helix transcriptional regulator [Lachnoclostridium pacaense]MCH1948332.1 helix-turn-helix transcriptional regulator [Enterocloster sp. OA13]